MYAIEAVVNSVVVKAELDYPALDPPAPAGLGVGDSVLSEIVAAVHKPKVAADKPGAVVRAVVSHVIPIYKVMSKGGFVNKRKNIKCPISGVFLGSPREL